MERFRVHQIVLAVAIGISALIIARGAGLIGTGPVAASAAASQSDSLTLPAGVFLTTGLALVLVVAGLIYAMSLAKKTAAAAKAEATEAEKGGSFDPDAIIARYMANREAAPPEDVPPQQFGRKSH